MPHECNRRMVFAFPGHMRGGCELPQAGADGRSSCARSARPRYVECGFRPVGAVQAAADTDFSTHAAQCLLIAA
jgi:hypothetical protein